MYNFLMIKNLLLTYNGAITNKYTYTIRDIEEIRTIRIKTKNNPYFHIKISF